MRPGRDVYRSPPSTVDVKQYTYTLPVCLHSVDRDKLTFFELGGGGGVVVVGKCEPNCYTVSFSLGFVSPFVLVFRFFRQFMLQFNSGWFHHVLGNFSV
jgi:hypothetical protein